MKVEHWLQTNICVEADVCTGDAQVLTALDKEDRRLFHDRLRYLDKRITPGVSKLAWTSPKATLDFFYKEACTYERPSVNMPTCYHLIPGLAQEISKGSV